MFTQTKIALAVALVLGTAFAASAATKPRVADDNQSAAYNVIPGYDKDGRTVGIADPNEAGVQLQR